MTRQHQRKSASQARSIRGSKSGGTKKGGGGFVIQMLMCLGIVVLLHHFLLPVVTGDTPTRGDIYHLEFVILGLIVIAFSVEELKNMMDRSMRRHLADRLGDISALMLAFASSVMIYGFLVRYLHL